MTEPIKKIHEGTDADAIYVLHNLAEADKCIIDAAQAGDFIEQRREAERAYRLKVGARLKTVHGQRSKKANVSDTILSETLRGTWEQWLDDNGIDRTTAWRHMKLVGYTEEERTETRQKAAKQKRESRAKLYRKGRNIVLQELLGLDKRTAAYLCKLHETKLKSYPGYFTDEAAAREFADWFKKTIPFKTKAPDKSVLREQDQRKVQRVVEAELEKLKKGFHEAVRQKAVKETDTLRETLHAQLKEAERERLRATELPRKTITEIEYRLILNCLHPDRAPADRRDRFEQAFIIVKRIFGKMFD